MAQAARLNLRMQKELRLLVTDPPPGASFPRLSSNSDLSSFTLTEIDAEIEGPEGTVYERGVFKIKIRIPERYPFQPPIVTFGTPIYHPNIDTGGRICLDILNLPPKGAWQPSINISTVLTSIGLLLSEPNPDDGLMCEASKEYKYNKQVFDQKARSMTEKFARPGASPNHGGNQSVSDLIMREDKPPEPVKTDLQEFATSFKKLSGISKKLSLDSCSGSNTRESDTNMNNDITANTLCQSQSQEPKQNSKDMSLESGKDHVLTAVNSECDQYNKPPVVNSECDQYNKPPAISSKKLCLSSKNPQHEKHEVLDSTILQNLDAQKENLLTVPKKPVDGNCITNPKRKKLGLTGKKPSLSFLGKPLNRNTDNKVKAREKDAVSSPVPKLSRKLLQVLEENAKVTNTNVTKNDEESLEQEGLCDPEGVIVLDSEEEKPSALNSRRLIARKRLLGRR
ncbi:uncharacterized protein LOC143610764 [Bidens hawaiensis]|uniref:uncharacterized protein LOC143610764 n=1 Tax=Bidens hawaiensis TaxID=980011 RepID=UPI0040493FEE